MTSNIKGPGRGKTQKFAVEQYKVEDYVLQKVKDNIPVIKISKLLKTEKGIEISHYSISRWLKTVMSQDNTSLISRQKFEVMVINYQNEITNILDEVKTMKDKARDENDLKIYDKLVGRLFQGLELLAKLMGDMRGEKKQVDINILINEISQRSFSENKDLRHMLYNPTIIDVEEDIEGKYKATTDELNNGDK